MSARAPLRRGLLFVATQFDWTNRNAAALELRMFKPADAPDPDRVYLHYLETCRRLGIEPVPREQAFGLIVGWTEVLTGRTDPPITH